MPQTNQTLLQHFKAKKSEKNTQALLEARRLVNLYRSLSCFGDDFLNKYNQMLLNVQPNVRRLFSTFMGGEEVEDYLEFLQENAHLTNTEVEQKEIQTTPQSKGYLPTPDMDVNISQSEDKIMISKEEWERMKAQKDSLLKQLQIVSNAAKNLTSSVQQTNFDNYSEIIEEEGAKK